MELYFSQNVLIFCLFLHENICCGYSLEAPQRGTSVDYPQHYLWRNKKNMFRICTSVALEWAATASSAVAASTGCTRNAVGSSTWQRTLTTDVHGARELHAPWMTEGSLSRTWQAVGGSLLLLPRRHALSSRWLWTFNHNTCENRLEEVQGAATSSVFTPPLFQDTWPCVQLMCAEHNAPCQWDSAIDKINPPTSAAEWQGNDQTDLQRQAARRYHNQVQWATCAAWHWGSGPHSEGEKALLVWTCGTL